MTNSRPCEWCRAQPAPKRGRFCSRKCRQSAFRLRRRRTTDEVNAQPGRFKYADPPYPGLAKRYYGNEPDYQGEVDHPALIASLEASDCTGWALSTSMDALTDILPLCPRGVTRVCAWVKPIGVPEATRGPHNTWEPLIVVRGRRLPPGVRDWLRAQPARGDAGMGRAVMGRKPLAFCAWLFDLLGMMPGDELDDLFPGTGIVSKAWASLGADANAGLSPEYSTDGQASPTDRVDVSSGAAQAAPGEASSRYHGDGRVSLAPRGIEGWVVGP